MSAEIQAEIAGALPECHALGVEPEGYDPREAACGLCPDKFTCLLDSYALTGVRPEVDSEVAAVAEKRATVAEMIDRMRRRQKVLSAGLEVPITLSTRGPIDALPPRPVGNLIPPMATILPPAPTPAQATSPGPGVAVRKKLKRGKRKLTRPASPAPASTPPARTRPKHKVASTGYYPPTDELGQLLPPTERTCLPNGRPLPAPRTVTPEQMEVLLRGGKGKIGVRIHTPIPLKPGMSIVRRKRDGKNVTVRLRPNGFEIDGTVYASLSSAAIASEKRIVSGNDYFDFQKRMGVELLDARGNVLARSTVEGGGGSNR